ncbi:MAG: prepilin peptidase [Chloroflexota bacterium]
MPAIELMILMAVAGLAFGPLVVASAPELARGSLKPGVVSHWPRILDSFPARSTIVGVVTAIILGGLAYDLRDDSRLVLAAIYTLLLIAIAYVDINYRLVLNKLTYPGIVLAWLLSWLVFAGDLESAMLGSLFGLVVFILLQVISRGALGTGDTKLAMLIGAMMGFPAVVSSLIVGVALGGLGAAFFWLVLRRGRKAYIAYAPYLAAGAVVWLFVGWQR